MKKKRIVIVEDERIIAEDIRGTLLSYQYDVLGIFANGEDAIKQIPSLNPDLVLMDIMLAGELNGVQTAKKILEYEDIPIIYLTAYANENILEDAKITQPYGYLIKPFQERELYATIEMAFHRHGLEEKLKKTQLRLSTVFQNVPNIILYETGKDRQFISENVNELLEYDDNTFIKNKQMFLERTHEDDLKIVTEKIKHWNSLQSEEMLTIWYRVNTKSGKLIWIEDRMIHVTTNNGEKYVTGVLIDNTAIKNAEAEKEKIREQLYQSQKMEVVGKLAGGIAHDFNNLLTAINGYADIALKKLPPHNDVIDDIQVIKDCGLKAAKLTQQLLGFSRKQIVERKLIDLNLVISELLKMLNRLIGENIKLGVSLSENPSLVLADSGQIEQVLINLVVNARDAMPNGGRITLGTTKKMISETEVSKHQLENRGEYVIITVNDTGSGMTEEVKAQIFEPFFTTKEIGKGTGLGLATVFGIIKQNDGFIDVDTEIGKGTTFHLYLPAASEFETMPLEPEPDIELEPSIGNETILLVEDEEPIREFVSSILEESGYKVLEAPSGVEGLKISEKYNETIHLLLSDIRMPKMSGPELARKLKEKHPETKLLFVSGHSDNDSIRKEIGDAYCGFLQKPFSYEGLLSKIRSELDKPKSK